MLHLQRPYADDKENDTMIMILQSQGIKYLMEKDDMITRA